MEPPLFAIAIVSPLLHRGDELRDRIQNGTVFYYLGRYIYLEPRKIIENFLVMNQESLLHSCHDAICCKINSGLRDKNIYAFKLSSSKLLHGTVYYFVIDLERHDNKYLSQKRMDSY